MSREAAIGGAARTERLRRCADVVAASLLLLLTAPVIAAGGLAVLVGSGRPVFFGHRRLGRGGRPFCCWKLRTMRVGAERLLREQPELARRHRDNGFKLPTSEDPRVTAVGRWLRPHHVDELPQLVNVLLGDMSLVGPRPTTSEELEHFGRGRDEILSVRPGIFGAWTSMGRRRPPYPQRAEVELDYVRHRSAARDLAILARSARAVLEGQEDA